MHIVVTGATGNVGTSVIEALSADPAVRSITAIARRVPEVKVHKTYFVGADVATEPLGPLFEGADAVIHLAWQFQPERRPEEIWSTNVLGSRRVFDAVRHAGVPRLVHASSFAVYAPRENDAPVDEDFATTGIPTSIYSRHKMEVERRLDEFEENNPQIAIVRLRPCLTLSERAAPAIFRRFAGPLVPRAALWLIAQQIGKQLAAARLQVVHSRDVAEAFRLAAASDVRGAINIAPRLVHATGRDEEAGGAGVMRRAAELGFRLGLHGTDPGWMDLVSAAPFLSTARARRDLGFIARYTANEALADALEGIRCTSLGISLPRLSSRPNAQLPYTAHVSA